MLPITGSSFESGANLFAVMNNGLTFFDSGLGVSVVDERFRFDVYLFFFCVMNLSSFSSAESKELKTSFDPLCIRVSCELFAVSADPVCCFCLEIVCGEF